MSQTREEELEMTVAEYRKQLSTVIAAINADFDGSNSEELRALKTSLEEVIAFTEVELISVKKQTLLDRLNNCGDSDDVYCVYDGHNGSQFIDHSKGDAKQSTSSSSHSFNDNNKKEEVDGDSDDKELMDSIRAMSGSKCMAPYVEQNGTVRYHNAIIMVTDAELSATTSDCDISVKVLFTNPICQSMKPCAHYMSGKCRYSDDKCRYSHGHRVSFASIKPYEEVNHSSLTIDSICLVKCAEDELWYKAVIDQYLEDTQQFVVKYVNSKIVDTVDIEHLLPLITNNTESDTSDDSSSSDDSGEENQQQEVKPCVATFPLRRRSASALGEWEMHTKGIGSKLMRKMGYVLGEGLGKNGEGRTNPIEVTVFPAGKSLDMCMRIKERRAGKDPNKETRRQRARKAKIACGYNRVIKSNKSSDSVFDFINNKVAKSGAKCDNNDNKDEASNRHVLSLSKLKSTDNQSLNVLSLKIAEDKRKAESELCRLQCSIETRKSKSRERESVAHLESQVVKQRNAIKSLCDQECAIQRELKLRSNNKKLQVF